MEHLAAQFKLLVWVLWVEVISLDSVLELSRFVEMLSHVGSKDGVNHKFSNPLVIWFFEVF